MEVYTLQEVAEKLKMSIHTLRKHIDKGQLKVSKLGRHIRITEEQLKEYLKLNIKEVKDD